MGTFPIPSPREVVKLLEAIGFSDVCQRASHKQFRHQDGRCTTVTVHGSRDVSPLLIRQIAKDIGLNVDELSRAR